MTTETTSAFLNRTSREYGIYVLENRAIPKLCDGLKSAQRKALFLMMGRADKIKTVSLAGTLISSNLYLHGDASASETISLLAAPFCNNVTFLKGEGNFGNRIGPKDIGAPRYTYVRRNDALNEIMAVDKDITPMMENYDGSAVEPVHFLPLIPTVLLNGVSGIAVGWSTEILPRTLKDLVEATLDAIDGKKLKNLPPSFERYDLSIKNIEGNQWEFSGKVKVVGDSVIVTELPPYTTLERFKERLNQMEDEDKIRTYTDNSAEDGINIEVVFKRGTIKNWTQNQAIDFLKLREKNTERMVVIGWDNKTVKQYQSTAQIIHEFVDWRLTWYTKRYKKLEKDDTYELQYWLAVNECFKNNFFAKLQGKKNRTEVEQEAIKCIGKIKLDKAQIDRLVSVPTYSWTDETWQKCKTKIKDLQANIATWQGYLASPKKLKSIYRDEVAALLNLKL